MGLKDVEPVPVPVDDRGREISTDVLHVVVQDHIKGCDQCRKAIAYGPPRGFNQRTLMCQKYLDLIQVYANGVEL